MVSVNIDPFRSLPHGRGSVGRYTVIGFATFIALLVLACAFFAANRNTDIDELALHNPAYMVAHYGRLTYPVETYFDLPMIVHPPIHMGLVGILSRLGFTWYYAGGAPTAFFLLLAIWTLARGNFPVPVKIGLLAGVGVLMSQGTLIASFFGSRPEGTLHGAWFAALLLLEAGRLDNWNRGSLFGGAFLLTWASSMHYYATPAAAGLLVYLVWVVRDLGWSRARTRLLALTGGALLFGLPYVVVYIVPHWSAIAAVIRYHQAGADLAPTNLSPIGQHLDWYRQWSAAPWLSWVLRRALGLGVPLMCFSTALLAMVRSTRGIAFASLPLQLGIFFFASHKPGVYLVHEVTLFAAALAVAGLVLLDRFVRWPITMPLAAAALCLYLATGTSALRSATLSAQVHPADLARAATRQILGPHARVISRPGAWYSSGAESWHDYHHDLTGPASSDYDPARYMQNFDAAADYPFRSGFDEDNREHKTLSAWYASGLLKLRGFYFAKEEGDLRLVLLSLNRPAALTGYAHIGGALYRFNESPAGDHEVIAARCPALGGFAAGRFQQVYPSTAIAVLDLPKSGAQPPGVMVTVLAPRSSPEVGGLLKQACTEVERVRGELTAVKPDALVSALRREDTPMRFYRHVEDLPGFRGVGTPAGLLPPQGAVDLPGVVNLAELDIADPAAKIDPGPPVRITTPAVLGAFGVQMPIHAAGKLAFPRWAHFRLRVLSGRIGLAAINRDGAMLTRSGLLLPSPEPVDVAIATPPGAVYVVLFNNEDPGSSQVEILDAAAVAAPPDSAVYRRLIEVEGASIVLGVPAELRPPAHAVRLESAIQLPESPLNVTTPASHGAFAVNLPLHWPEGVAGDAWVQLRLRVISGRVGLAVAGSKGEIRARTTEFLPPTPEPVVVALKVPAQSRGANFVVFNENPASPSRVEILEAAVVVAK